MIKKLNYYCKQHHTILLTLLLSVMIDYGVSSPTSMMNESDNDDINSKLQVGSWNFDLYPNTTVVQRILKYVPYILGTKVVLDCPVPQSMTFVTWLQAAYIVAGTEQRLELPISDSYHFGRLFLCLYRDPSVAEKYYGIAFIFNEMPSEDKVKDTLWGYMSKPVSVNCDYASNAIGYAWWQYNARRGRFLAFRNTTYRRLLLSDDELTSGGTDNGFTFYKCSPYNGSTDADEGDWSAIYKVEKGNYFDNRNGYLIYQFDINAQRAELSIAVIPKAVLYESVLQIWCYTVDEDVEADWLYRTLEPDSQFKKLSQSANGQVEVYNLNSYSVLKVRNMTSEFVGFYKCHIDGYRPAYARIELYKVQPIIRPTWHGYRIFNMTLSPGSFNKIECEIPTGGRVTSTKWRVGPTEGTSYDLAVDEAEGPFSTVLVNDFLTYITFNDSLELDGYRVECWLETKYDFVFIVV